MTADPGQRPHRELVTLVLVEAVGSSLTPFVPVPFVDDYLYERLLRRVAGKVASRRGLPPAPEVAKTIVASYTRAGASSLGARAVEVAARFVVRKVAVVLDVKKSHDVFGEAIAFALALDVAFEIAPYADPRAIGEALHRAHQGVGSAVVEVLTRAGRAAFARDPSAAPDSSRLARVSDAIGAQVDDARARLDRAVRFELQGVART